MSLPEVHPRSVLGRLAARARTCAPGGATAHRHARPATFAERVRAAFAEWREEDHPRAQDGEFATVEGRTGAPEAEAPPAAEAAPKPAGKARDPRLPAIGETFARSYRGWQIKVRADEDGFHLLEGPEEHKGKTYPSLSRLATTVTGTSTNGHLWFSKARKIQPREEAPAGPPGPPRPPEAPTPAGPPPTQPVNAQGQVEAPQPTLEQISVDEIGVDPARFQFKRATSAITGAGNQFKDVKRFDPVKAGIVLAWRDKSGKVWVADGHHRVDLAKRLGAGKINAFVLDESQGVTHQQARATAALRNIADGKGDALDAAKAIRDTGWTVDDIEREGISATSTLARDGLGIANLTAGVFNLVVDDMLPQHYAAEIGRELPSPDKQRQAASAVEGARNIAEVQSVVRQIKSAPERTSAEQTLWGDEISTKSLYLERAQIETALHRRLKSDKALFRTLAGKASKAESVEGTQINREGSEAKASGADELALILSTYANSTGTVKDALDEAATTYAESKRRPSDVEAAVDRVADALRSVNWRTGDARQDAPRDPPHDEGGFFAAQPARGLRQGLEAVGVHPRSVLGRLALRHLSRFSTFREEDHPRKADGEFAPKGEGQTMQAAPTKPPPAAPKKATGPRDPRIPEPGSKIKRTWRGVEHEVEVRETGYALTKGPEHLIGKEHSSLTALAKALTGAKAINGVAWFGLGKAKPDAPKVVDVEDQPNPTPEKSSVVPPAPTKPLPRHIATPARQEHLAKMESVAANLIEDTLKAGWESKEMTHYYGSGTLAERMKKISAGDLDKKLQDAPIYVRIEPDAFVKMMRDRRFKSRSEVYEETPPKAYDARKDPDDIDGDDAYLEMRNAVESETFGEPTPDVIYGALHTEGLDSTADNYGPISCVLRRETTEHRATFTPDDSFQFMGDVRGLDGVGVARGALGRRACAAYHIRRGKYVTDYIEAQIHGGVTVDDIDHIRMPARLANKIPGLKIPRVFGRLVPDQATMHGRPIRLKFED